MRSSLKSLMLMAALGVLVVYGAAPQKADSTEAMLRAAMDKEMVDGDLKAAIEQYKKIIGRGGASRDMVAKALVRLGLCYEKQGSAEARKSFERVVREFPDQAEAVEQARRRLSAGTSAKPSGLSQRRVWGGPDVPWRANVSRDGRYLAYFKDKQIALRDLNSGETRLIAKIEAESLSAALSPDGKRIAFWANYGNGLDDIRVINIDGSGMRSLYQGEEAWFEGWSPDGKRILTGEWRRKEDRGALSWINIADGTIQEVATQARNNGGGILSPDGRYIAFSGLPAGTPPQKGTRVPDDVYLIASDGSGETVLSADPAAEYPVGWSPDGKQVIFASLRGSTWGLWAIPVKEGKTNGTARGLGVYLGTRFRRLGVTQTGAFYYWNQDTLASDVFTASMDPATGRVTSAPLLLRAGRSGNNVAPRFSPDGRRILTTWVEGTGGGTFREMTILPIGEGREQRLAPFPGAGWCWTADAKSVIANREGGTAITRIDIETGATNVVVQAHGIPTLSCSSNGKRIALETPSRAIMVHDVDNGQEKEIYKAPSNSWGLLAPEVSPDGQQVAFVTEETRGWFLRVAPAAGGEPRELARLQAPAMLQRLKGLAWSPDSRFVYFVKMADENAPNELFRIAATGGREESMGLKMPVIRDLNISPDGTRIAFSNAASRPEIWAVENFLPSK